MHYNINHEDTYKQYAVAIQFSLSEIIYYITPMYNRAI